SAPGDLCARSFDLNAWLAIKKRRSPTEDQDENPVEHDLLDHDRTWHRLHHVIDDVGWYDGQRRDCQAEANALREPRSDLDTARVNPDERTCQEHMGQDHQRKVWLRIGLRSEKAG